MTENETPFEAGLRRLGDRLRIGMAKRQPVKAEHIESVRGLVRRQWEAEQQHQDAGGGAKRSTATEKEGEKRAQSSEEKQRSKRASKGKPQDQDWGHDY